MTFGEVLESLRAGRRCTRRSWLGRWIELEIADDYGTGPSWITRRESDPYACVELSVVDILATDWEVVP